MKNMFLESQVVSQRHLLVIKEKLTKVNLSDTSSTMWPKLTFQIMQKVETLWQILGSKTNKEWFWSEFRQRHMPWMGKSVLICEHYTRVSKMGSLEIKEGSGNLPDWRR